MSAPPPSSEQLKHAVRGSTRALVVAQIVSHLITLATLAVLLRLILPSAYGLLGMVIPVLFFLRIFSTLGLNVATVQRAELVPSETSALFWLNVLFGLAVTLVTVLVAPAVAWFYRRAELLPLVVALSGTSLAAALGAQHQALLERKLQLGRLAVCRIAGQLCGSLAAIAAALAGWDVWALVVQQYTDLSLTSLFLWIAEPWRPMRFNRRAPIASHLRLGGYYSASSVLFFLAGNLDKVLLGRLVGEVALGLYTQALNLVLKLVYFVTSPLTGVMLSALARAAEDDAGRQRLLVAFVRIVAIALLPASVGLALVGDQAMLVLGGPQWKAAGPIVVILAVAIFAQGTINIAGPVYTAAGKTDRLFYAALALTALLAPAYVVGWWFGREHGAPALGVAAAYAATLLVVVIPYSLYAWRATGYRPQPILAALVRPLLAALGMGVVVWLVRQSLGSGAVLLQLLLEIAAGVASYALLARKEVLWLLAQLRQLRARGTTAGSPHSAPYRS